MLHAIDKWSAERVAATEQEFYDDACRGLATRRIGNVSIHGCETFLDEVTESLSWLERAYPYGFRLVQRYIRGIVEHPVMRKWGQVLGVRYQRSTRAGRLTGARNRFAAALVHDATVTRFIRGFTLVRSRRRLLSALKHERKTMQLLNCHPCYFHAQDAQIQERES